MIEKETLPNCDPLCDKFSKPLLHVTYTMSEKLFHKSSQFRPDYSCSSRDQEAMHNSGRRFGQFSRYPRSRTLSSLLWSLTLMIVLLSTTEAGHKCTLPESWHGKWFNSGISDPVIVNATTLSHKGVCIQSRRDRYLINNLEHGCFRCLVIHQKHKNVLQYKETFCSREKSLEAVCDTLAGDSALHSLFRQEANPVACPFPHTYIFTYNRGYGACTFPPSNVFSCTEDWRLLFRYQACPDVIGTESTSEELVCLAVWKEGSNRYLVGKSNGPHATSDEDRYRCFVYDTWEVGGKSGFKVALSGDATCNGLFSVNDGSRTLRLTKVDTSATRCKYPEWVGATYWHSLDGGTNLHVTKHNSTLRLTGHSVSSGPATLMCLQKESQSSYSSTFITRVTHGCNSGYQCVQLISRDKYVMEVTMGRIASLAEEACSKHFFNISSTNISTFVSAAAESRTCPETGRYEVLAGTRQPSKGKQSVAKDPMDLTVGNCEEGPFTALNVGCSSHDKLELHTSCSHSVYSCHGWWAESGRQYLVVTPTSRSSKGFRRLCLVLNRGETGLSLASSGSSCSRELVPGLHGHIALNTTNSGSCESVLPSSGLSKATNVKHESLSWVVSFILIFGIIYSSLRDTRR